VGGAGAENGAERARKSDERKRSGSGAGGRAESAAHNPLKPNIAYIIRILQSISNFQIQIAYVNHSVLDGRRRNTI